MLKRDVGRFMITLKEPKCINMKEDGTCKDYDNRLGTRVANGATCITARQAFEKKLLPNDCPYVKHYGKGKKYRTRVLNY
jgi:uncharacterized cysteine cluster protein YcgN (CxxCxxCC family)